MTESNTEIKQELIIKNKKSLSLDGVINVESFGEDYMTIETKGGNVGVEGSDLKIESLTKEDGKILVVGNITGVFYRSGTDKKGFFSKIFG